MNYSRAQAAPTEQVAPDPDRPHYQALLNVATGHMDVVQNLHTGALVPLDAPGYLLDEYQRYVAAGGQVLAAQEDNDAERLLQLKTRLLVEVAQAAQTFIDTATQDVAPRIERDTYPLQAAEAQSWAMDNNASTPMLAGIAHARQMDLDELRLRTLNKSRAWQGLCADVIGQRQAYEDRIHAATTVAELTDLVIDYATPDAPDTSDAADAAASL